LESEDQRQILELSAIPHDFRLQMEVVPEAGASLFGIELRATADQAGCELIFDPQRERVRFSKMTDSGGGVGAGPGIEAVAGLDRPFKIDLVARHDILDVEIAAFRSVTTRFWNPDGDRLRLFVEGGAVSFRNIRIRPLKGTYEPYPGWSRPRASRRQGRAASFRVQEAILTAPRWRTPSYRSKGSGCCTTAPLTVTLVWLSSLRAQTRRFPLRSSGAWHIFFGNMGSVG
jgi:hypothetical protein